MDNPDTVERSYPLFKRKHDHSSCFGNNCIISSYIYFKGQDRTGAIRNFGICLIIFLFFAFLLVGIKINLEIQEGYASFSFLGKNISLNLSNYLKQSPDSLLVFVLCLSLGLLSLYRLFKTKPGHLPDLRSQMEAVLGWGFLMTSLAYFFILLIWRWSANYYMLPITAYMSISLGFFTVHLLTDNQEGGLHFKFKSLISGLIVIVLLISRFYTIPYLHFIATAQRGFDRIENEVAQEAIKIKPVQQRIIDVDRPYFAEPPFERTLLYNLLGTPNFFWVGGRELLMESSEELKKQYNPKDPSPLLHLPPSEGDLVLIQTSIYPFNIELRGIGPHVMTDAEGRAELQILEQKIGLSLIKIQSWKDEWVVFKPWTLNKARLGFCSTIYRFSRASNNMSPIK